MVNFVVISFLFYYSVDIDGVDTTAIVAMGGLHWGKRTTIVPRTYPLVDSHENRLCLFRPQCHAPNKRDFEVERPTAI